MDAVEWNPKIKVLKIRFHFLAHDIYTQETVPGLQWNFFASEVVGAL